MKKPYPHFETAEKKCVRLSKLNNVSEFVALLSLPNVSDLVTTVKWGPVFHVVRQLIVINDDIHLVTKRLRDCYPVQRVHAYRVIDNRDFSWWCLTLSDVRRASITYLTTLSDGGTYIFRNWIE
ncbi:hypothetical protein QAD02_012747 [Eretmocerus hayati]|uniref:Uncharacterized protein n=1 Tax=Eretmocerus hayati TaxID=131215 RepID=A0ACC2P0A4_9HYME|nr:hypothetical protein QAD02_012747 [Eretmocerus hayati]